MEIPQLCLHQLFEVRVEAALDRVAVVHGDCALTYATLNHKANQLAHYLRAQGVGPEVRVGVCLERSPDLVVVLLGILKAGGAYVPLDPAYPEDRLQFMLKNSGSVLLLTRIGRAPQTLMQTAKTIDCESLLKELDNQQSCNPAPWTRACNMAYVIYTSGSTGRPKGTVIEHGSAVALADWARQTYSMAELAGVLAATSVCFDLSVFEIFVPLAWGGTVIVAENFLELPQIPHRNRVTLLNTVPSAMQELLKIDSAPAGVLTVNLAGEPLKPSLACQVYRETAADKLFNLYGPTEDTTYSTYALQPREPFHKPVSIGRPISNTQAYVLNAQMQALPVGIAGELYLAGAGLARGYLGCADLTAARFVPDPFSRKPGARMYRTGDLVQWLENGELDFLGRLDHQVKIRGFRIELREIEAVLARHDGVRDVVVVVREDSEDDKRLVAYWVAASDTAPSPDTLRAFLLQTLPEYMAPATFIRMAFLPLNANGKVDRKALPRPGLSERLSKKEFLPPGNEMERAVAEVWQRVLNVDHVGVLDNFFELGGHSLLMIQVYSALKRLVEFPLELTDLFKYPTVATLADFMAGREGPRPSRSAESSRQEEKLRQGRSRLEEQLKKRARSVSVNGELI